MKPKLPKVGKLQLGDGEVIDLDYYLSQEYEDIVTASQELPALIEWINARLQENIELKIVTKQKIRSVEAKVYFYLKSGGFIERGYGPKMTDKGLERAIALDPKVSQVWDDFAVLSGWVSRLQNLLSSFQAKLDLVRSSEATRRKIEPDEMNNDDDDRS